MAKSLSLCPCFGEKNMHFLYCSFLMCKVNIIMAIKFRELPYETGIKTIPMEKKCKKAKWLSEEALQIAEKEER